MTHGLSTIHKLHRSHWLWYNNTMPIMEHRLHHSWHKSQYLCRSQYVDCVQEYNLHGLGCTTWIATYDGGTICGCISHTIHLDNSSWRVDHGILVALLTMRALSMVLWNRDILCTHADHIAHDTFIVMFHASPIVRCANMMIAHIIPIIKTWRLRHSNALTTLL